jgi:hypothetical protein
VFGRVRQMRHFAPAGGLAVGLLLCAAIFLTLRISGLLRLSPVQFPNWVGWILALTMLAMPPLLTFAESLHSGVRLIAGVIFMGTTFIFPWFYDQLPICFWVTMLLLYAEAFGIIPLVLRRQRRKSLSR